MKKSFLFAAAALCFCACQKEEVKPIASVDAPFTGSVMAGVPESVKVAGAGFQATDSVYVAWEGGSEAVSAISIAETEIVFGFDAYSQAKGKTVKAVLYRDGKTLDLTGDITVTAPTVADGFIPDPALLDALWAHNGDVRAMIGPCRLIDVKAAAALVQDTQCDNEWGILAIDGNGATSYEGLEMFSSLGKGLKTMEDQEYKNFICWGAGNIEEIDFSNWDAYIQVRAASCANLKKVILGPNMKGGSFENSPVEYFDMHLASGADWVMNLSNLKYADLTRTYIDGGSYNVNFNHFRGSGNVNNITFADDAEIHIDSEVYGHNWTAGGVRNNIVAAWQKGAKVIVHDIWNYDQKFEVASYASDPNAMTADLD